MHTTLTRAEFNERLLSPDDLQWIAAMLADWHHQVRGHIPSLTLNVELWGFPKQGEEAVRRHLAARVASLQVLTLGVPLNPPYGELAPMVGGLLWALGDPAFEGLAAEVRLTLGVDNPRTVVLYGLIQGCAFLLRAVWAAGAGEFQEEAYTHTPWAHETQFLGALFDYRNGNRTAPAWARTALFPDGGQRTVMSGIAWLLSPTDKKRVSGFLLRVAVTGAAFILSALGVAAARSTAPAWTGFAIMGVVVSGLALAFTVGIKGFMIYEMRRRMCEAFRKLYSGPVRHLEVDLADTPGALQDPALRKYSAEIVALGGQHFKDVRPEPPPVGTHSVRMYLFPDDGTIMSLMLMHSDGTNRTFPAKASYLLRTDLSDGNRLVTISGSAGYRKRLPLPVISRLFPGVTDPEEMLQRHRAALSAIEREGRKRLPIQPERILAQMDEEHLATAGAMRKYGYFHWDDAVRMVFDLPRKEYK